MMHYPATRPSPGQPPPTHTPRGAGFGSPRSNASTSARINAALKMAPPRLERPGSTRRQPVLLGKGGTCWRSTCSLLDLTLRWTCLSASHRMSKRLDHEKRELISDIWGKRGATYREKGVCRRLKKKRNTSLVRGQPPPRQGVEPLLRLVPGHTTRGALLDPPTR